MAANFFIWGLVATVLCIILAYCFYGQALPGVGVTTLNNHVEVSAHVAGKWAAYKAFVALSIVSGVVWLMGCLMLVMNHRARLADVLKERAEQRARPD